MNTDVLLINPRPLATGINEATIEVPLGILYIASFLESKGFNCKVLDANAMSLGIEEIIKNVIELSPLLIGISINAFSYQAALTYARQIKKNLPDAIIILGGPQATSAPDLCLENHGIEAVVCSEGEFPTYRIIDNLKKQNHPFKDVPGVVYKMGGQIIYNPPATRILDLDSLPFPAYHLLPNLRYYRAFVRKWPFMGIVTSRGCPYQCTFCSKSVFGNRVAFRSPENVISEIEFLTRSMGIRQIDILDDNFTSDRGRCEKICDLLIKKSIKISINLQSGVRIDNIDRDLLLLLKKAGVFKIAFGVESGDEDILGAIRKNTDPERILMVGRWAREAGMVVIGFFMLGLPYENSKTLQKTIDFAKKMNPHFANFMITIPFYGTPLYSLVEEKGRFLIDTKKGVMVGFYGGNVFFEFGNLTKEIVEHYYNNAYRDFYFRIVKIYDVIASCRSYSEIRWLLMATKSVLTNNIRQWNNKI